MSVFLREARQQKSGEGTMQHAQGDARGAGSIPTPSLRRHSMQRQTLGTPQVLGAAKRPHLQGGEMTLWQHLLGASGDQAVP